MGQLYALMPSIFTILAEFLPILPLNFYKSGDNIQLSLVFVSPVAVLSIYSAGE
jgi:hypothetical protein